MKKNLLILATALGAGFIAVQAASVAENYEEHCMSCHGRDGQGKTKAGRKAKAKDFTDKAYQAKFSDAEAFKSMKEGLKDDKGREAMKPYADRLNDEEMKELVALVRTFAK